MLNQNKLRDVIVKETDDMRSAMKSLKNTKIGIVVVVDAFDRVVGVVTSGDIRDILFSNRDAVQTTVASFMNRDFARVQEGCGREMVLKLLDINIHTILMLNTKGQLVNLVGSEYKKLDKIEISRARTPARASLSGGGTDFTNYFMDNGGAGLSCTISKYSHAVLRKREDRRVTIYSHDFNQRIEVDDINNLAYNGELDLIKAGVKLLKPDYGFDLEIGCDFPPASGLGGSASLLASVIGCFNEFRDRRLDKYEISEFAFEAERIELNIAGGWQDQYSTVFGGFNYLEFDRNHNVVMPLRLEPEYIQEFEERFILCHTEGSHLGEVIQEGNHNPKNIEKNKFENANILKQITVDMKGALLRGDFESFGTLLGKTWKIKKDSDSRVTNSKLDRCYEVAMKAGAAGGRLLGTGGGGYFLFFVPPFKRYSVIKSLEKIGFHPETVLIDESGLRSWKV
jgi:D-glycero-alpha-D-manno-heptose-7-phosphate kinase